MLTLIIIFREEQDALAQKLAAIEKKIIVGGENLLEKAEEQERLLEESAVELQERKVREEQLRKALEEKEVWFYPLYKPLLSYLMLIL